MRGFVKQIQLKSCMKEIKRLFIETRPLWGILALTALMGLVSAAIGLAAPWIFREIVNFLTSGNLSALFDQLIPVSDPLQILIYLVIFYYIIEIIEYAWRSASFYVTSWFGLYSRKLLAERAFRKIHELSVGYFDDVKPGVLRERLLNYGEIYRMVRAMLVDTAPLIFNFIIAVVIIAHFNLILSLGLLLTSPLYAIMSFYRTKARKLREKEVRDMREAKSSILHDNLHYHNLIKEFAREDFEKKRFASVQEREIKVERAQDKIEAWFGFWSPVLYSLSTVWIYGYGGYLILQSQLQLGDLILFAGYADRMLQQIRSFLYLYDDIQVGLVSTGRYFDVIDYIDPIQDVPGAKALKVGKGELKFEDITFTYEGADHNTPRKVFKNFNITIQPKEKIALVGPSGVGKSTFVKLLMRFYDPQGGSILIDGQDIRTVTQTSLRKKVSTVMQDALVLNEEIGYNIKFGKPSATLEAVKRATRTANLHGFVQGLKDKFKTKVGERGIKLSGGEKQRLAIARAVLKDAPIVVLDEATSALDSENEKAIQDAMWKLIKGRTTIIIAHRLSTVRKVDRIIVFGKGGIVEEGSHDQLMKKKNGYYRRLYTMQGDALLA